MARFGLLVLVLLARLVTPPVCCCHAHPEADDPHLHLPVPHESDSEEHDHEAVIELSGDLTGPLPPVAAAPPPDALAAAFVPPAPVAPRDRAAGTAFSQVAAPDGPVLARTSRLLI